MKIKIADLDLSLQTRDGTDAETINNYAEAMADGAHFPDVTAFTDGAKYWLADGFHRVMAMKQLGQTHIAADVRKGTADDAVVFGGTANNKQGKRPTRADVQHFLEMVWERREAIFGGTPTGGALAEKCGVSRQTATTFLNVHLSKLDTCQTPTRLVGADRKTYPVRPQMPVRAPVRPAAPAVMPVRPSAPAPMPERPAKPAHLVPVDRYGVEIPVEINAAFEGGALADLLATVSRARVALRRGMEDGEPSFAAVRQDALVNLNNAYSFISAAEAHCVCRMCQGTGCKACHDRGWQTEEEYKRNPREFKAE